MSGVIPPLPQYAFIAWCSVKAQGQLYHNLTLKSDKINNHLLETMCKFPTLVVYLWHNHRNGH